MTPAQEAKVAKMRTEYATIREAKKRAEEILSRMPEGIERARFQGQIDKMAYDMDYLKHEAERIKTGANYKPKKERCPQLVEYDGSEPRMYGCVLKGKM